METHTAPHNADDQSKILIEASIAEQALAALHQDRRDTEQATLDSCRFWARTVENFDGIRGLHLQVVVKYPRRGLSPFVVYVLTVAASGRPWHLAGDTTLTPAQLRIVEELADSERSDT